MPKVFALHEMELQPGVEPEEYERFLPKRSHRCPSSRGGRPVFCSFSSIQAVRSGTRHRLERSSARRPFSGQSQQLARLRWRNVFRDVLRSRFATDSQPGLGRIEA
jgi:hypothetical protein